ncbi:MAG TPA: NAD-dependent succinate-semialdehyde dehydrogenase [Thermoanaerobaculia bacterium]|nr:NAD-dependent succinate-semialdehyde dehydrogenase [Thermoanaerobaculia bacterium]
MTIASVNPETGETTRTYDEMQPAAVDRAVEAAHAAFRRWRGTSFEERAPLLRAAGRLLRERRRDYAELMTREMGKVLAGGLAEIDKCAAVCDFYAARAATFLAPEVVATEASRSFVAFEPLGVVLAVMPWNFPFWQVFRFAAPALMAGNAGILKHASNVPGCALAIEEVCRDAGLPDGLFRTLLVPSKGVERVIEHPRVVAVTLTGSTPAGRAVAAKAGSLLKKTVLELGGSDPYLILDDADLDQAVATCVESRLINSGQSCIAAKRFIIPRRLAADVERRFVAAMAAKVVGDPMREGTHVGPLARRDLRDQLHAQVEASRRAGARCLLGGEVPEGPGAFYPPTVLAGVAPGMPAYDEELFGPVAALLAVDDEEDAIRVANDSVFGLGAAVFTRDARRGEAVARRLEAGSCFVNDLVRSDPRLPFGGIKQSGYGRELGPFGIREFVNVKTVYVK